MEVPGWCFQERNHACDTGGRRSGGPGAALAAGGGATGDPLSASAAPSPCPCAATDGLSRVRRGWCGPRSVVCELLRGRRAWLQVLARVEPARSWWSLSWQPLLQLRRHLGSGLRPGGRPWPPCVSEGSTAQGHGLARPLSALTRRSRSPCREMSSLRPGRSQDGRALGPRKEAAPALTCLRPRPGPRLAQKDIFH